MFGRVASLKDIKQGSGASAIDKVAQERRKQSRCGTYSPIDLTCEYERKRDGPISYRLDSSSNDNHRPARFAAESRHSYACSPSSQPPSCAVAAKAIESPPKANGTRPTGFVAGYTRAYWRRTVPASHLAPLALAGHLLIEPSMQTLTEADRQLEDQVVGGQDQNVAR